MANAVYPFAKERALVGGINWSTGDIRFGLVRTTGGDNEYTYSSTHQFLDSISTNAIRAQTTAGVGSKTVAGGVADAADVTFSAVASTLALQAIVGYEHVTDASDSKLIFYVDTSTGLPVTPNGGDITVQRDAGANKIFAI